MDLWDLSIEEQVMISFKRPPHWAETDESEMRINLEEAREISQRSELRSVEIHGLPTRLEIRFIFMYI